MEMDKNLSDQKRLSDYWYWLNDSDSVYFVSIEDSNFFTKIKPDSTMGLRPAFEIG